MNKSGRKSKFLQQVEAGWRAIALNLLHHYSHHPPSQLRLSAQRLLCHTLFQHLCEQQGLAVESYLPQSALPNACPFLPQGEGLGGRGELTDSLQQLFHSLKGLTAESLGRAYEHCLGLNLSTTEVKTNRKKIGGVYYTPTAIVDQMVRDTVGKRLAEPGNGLTEKLTLRILDPACGSGIFLLRAYHYLLDWYRDRYLAAGSRNASHLVQRSDGTWRLTLTARQRILLNHIHGVDIDPQAVEITRLSLWLKLLEEGAGHPLSAAIDWNRNIRCGNALIDSEAGCPPPSDGGAYPSNTPFNWSFAFPNAMQSGGFDVVLSNPPYIDSETMAATLPTWRNYCKIHYRTATGNWDLFCIFIEKGLDLCKPGGLVSMIVPNKLASAHYAIQTRALLAVENQLQSISDYSSSGVFAVAVYPLVYVAAKTPPSAIATVRYPAGSLPYLPHFTQPETPWPLCPNLEALKLTTRLRQEFSNLANMAQVVGAASVADAYQIQSLIQEQPIPQPGDLRLVNSGTIDRYWLLWGIKSCRYLGSSYRHPIIPSNLRSQLSKRREEQASQPKIMVAGLTKHLECALDPMGTVLAGKSTSLVLAEKHLAFLLGVLNSKLMRFYVTQVFGGNSLQGGYLRIGPPQLRQLPIPAISSLPSTHDCRYQQLVSLVKQMQSLDHSEGVTVTADQPKMAALDAEIDPIVYALYGLSQTEIEVVEANNRVGLGA